MRSSLTQARSQKGFTLIELLVVMLILGILASVGISALINRRIVANDASAKQLVNTSQHAAIIYSLNSLNGFIGMTPASLKAVEPSINTVANGQTVLAAVTPSGTGYTLAAVSAAGDTFNVISTNGVLSRTCTVGAGNGNTVTNAGGGCTNGTW
jgi:prepilin-type N-terminal cleavage/methylation domain-containing protein